MPHPLWENYKQIIQALEPDIRALRRELHRYPEPSNEEFQTTARIVEILERENIRVKTAPTGRGLVADSSYQDGEKRIAIRADMDALRIQDEKAVEYRSTRPNLMHACGHDAHTAMLVGTVRALSQLEKLAASNLTWRAIFQPAEETASGALEMIGWGAMKQVDAIGALHVDPLYPKGKVTSRPGALSAICEEIEITIHGRGGHGARPHQTIDPIAAGSALITRIYEEVPRQVSGPEPSVVSFGVFEAGINSNVIPDTARIRGTLRTVSEESSKTIKLRIQELIKQTEKTTGARIQFERKYHLPSVYNDPGLFDSWSCLAKEIVGENNLVTLEQPSMGGEDFACYLQHAPGCMLRLGVGKDGQEPQVLHSSKFDINEDALLIGMQLLGAFVLNHSQQNPT
ncbi:MAG: amidohydrolase [Verrucomicrobiae bacterium]|nr:amidohydrolase [Verrucomicrobiae bacterium]